MDRGIYLEWDCLWDDDRVNFRKGMHWRRLPNGREDPWDLNQYPVSNGNVYSQMAYERETRQRVAQLVKKKYAKQGLAVPGDIDDKLQRYLEEVDIDVEHYGS